MFLSKWDAFDDSSLLGFFVHHPRACMHVLKLFRGDRPVRSISKAVGQMHSSGYCASETHVSTDDWSELTRNQAAKSHPWLESAIAAAGVEVREASNLHMNGLHDYLALWLLYNYGGTYIGQPSLFLQPLPDLDRFILLKNVTTVEEWTFDKPGRRELSLTLTRLRKGSRIAMMALRYYSLSRHFTLHMNRTSGAIGSAALHRAFYDYTQLAGANTPALLPEDYVFNVDVNRNALAFAAGVKSAPSYFRRMQRSYYAIQGARLPGLIQSHLSVFGNTRPGGTHAPDDCHLRGPRTVIVRGSHARLRGPHVVSLVDCLNHDSSVRGPMQVTIQVTHGTLINSCVNGSLRGSTLNSVGLNSAADVNVFLSCVSYHVGSRRVEVPQDVLKLRIVSARGTLIANLVVDVVVFQYAVTVMVHTHGRVDNINRMAQTVQQWYPHTNLCCANEDPSGAHYSRVPAIPWLPTSDRSVESFNRNKMVQAITTPFVLLLGDDLEVHAHSNLDVLLERLYTGEYDIASPRIISAENATVNGRGHKTTNGDINMHGMMSLMKGGRADCTRVDRVPSVFLARRSVLGKSVLNYAEKRRRVDERFARMLSKVRIATCEHATVLRVQDI